MQNFIRRWRNRVIAFSFDLVMIPVAWVTAFWLNSDLHQFSISILGSSFVNWILVFVAQAGSFWLFGLYRGVWRFASIPDLIRITKAVTFGIICIILVFFIVNKTEMPRVIPVLYGILLGGSLAGARAIFRWLKDYRRFFQGSNRVLIVGAGYAGESLVRDLLRNNNHLYQPIVIVDDDLVKVGRDIHGIPIAGKCEKIPTLVKDFKIDLILIAIPSASSSDMRKIVDFCGKTTLPFRTLPSINDLAKGRVDIRLLRDVSLEDLLGRDQVDLDWLSIGKDLQNKIILVSGGGGSIGSELCRQIAALNPRQLIIVDNCEFNLYSIDMELRKKFPYLSFHSALLDISDKRGLELIFAKFSPNVVFHAAAYKHVPLLETHARIAIHNNILGTNILANTAVSFGVDKFVFISTDKAVNPANLMGATKRAAEMICQNLYDQSLTKFITVRFGNVLDSAGSVLPLFRKQIQEGGPITVTHPDITRFFMSIPEAAQLIVQAATLGKGGEIFVLDMGEPIKIDYLAEQMCKLAGKTVGVDIEIEYTGLRPGEKLYEELFYKNEELYPTIHNKILLANASKVEKNILHQFLNNIEKAIQIGDEKGLYLFLSQLLPEFKNGSKNIVDSFIENSVLN